MLYPINVDVAGKKCVVVGGGAVALRKVKGLLAANAEIILIAPKLCDDLQSIVNERKIRWINNSYAFGCIPRGVLLIAATNDPEINRLAALEASQKNMLVNVVDSAEIDETIRFENPSTIRRGHLLITISTDGTSPAVSKIIRQKLESIFNDDFDQRLETIEKLRQTVKNTLKNPADRVEFWRAAMNDDILFAAADAEALEVNIHNALDSYRAQSQDRAD